MSTKINVKAGGYIPASFLDWEGRVAAVIFTLGCNFRCPWCHNGALALCAAEEAPLEPMLADIKRRAKFLDGAVISGGEPAMQPGLPDLIDELSSYGLQIKLDTNGSFPEVLQPLLEAKKITCAAMDVKAPLDAGSYKKLCCADADIIKIKSSVKMIKALAPEYEFRTTYVPALHTIEDLRRIEAELADDAHWRLQLFKPNGCLDPEYLNHKAAQEDFLKKYFKNIKIRG